MINQHPKGGTELQFDYLKKYVDEKLLSQVQICTSVPEKIPLDPKKVNILWQKNSYDQPNLHPWFKDKSNHNKYDWYVFNSHWNFEKFRMVFDIPTHKCVVIKNGIDRIVRSKPYKEGDPIKIIHQNTPWRGLSVLLGAMQLVKNPLITLDVYSSTEVYGKNFYEQNDNDYKELYKQAQQLPNVNYIGYKPNQYIKDHLHEYHMYAYPSIFEETFCISLLECMAAGLYCITTNYGALFETGAEFPMYIPYEKNKRLLAQKFAFGIEAAAKSLHEKQIHNHLECQWAYASTYYSWNKIGASWKRFLEGAINAKR
ncbi:MAG: glycosyltransferase, partial [Candidatus Dadabacteria bacterium]|nr:glycosyltransferase [Candidatus Dadabacteria bacterium]NIQ14887.1 glycosyltransferase [Candidatus Dadabacteria bacterium]